MNIKIEPYTPKYSDAFYKLNEAWITTYFQMEKPDRDALGNPQEYILDKGGSIFIATVDDEPVGVCALIKRDDLNCYELAKMAVSPQAQGKGIGFQLGRAAIEKATVLKAERIFLESNTVLEPAIKLYEKLGFQRLDGFSSPYKRCNIQMELVLETPSREGKRTKMDIEIRPEKAEDAQAIRRVTDAAFEFNLHSSGTEGAIIEALREAGALVVSLVATIDHEVVGHIAFSPVTIDGQDLGWFGLGPVSIRPDLQGQGIGSALIREGLQRLKQAEAAGCVLLGDPHFYQRFGFENDAGLRYEGAPAEYFMRLNLQDATPSGIVAFHEGFAAT